MELDFVLVVDGKVCAVEVRSGNNRRSPSLSKAVCDMGLEGIVFETRNCFVDDKGVRHYPLFAASFMDSIDHKVMPVFDFDSVDRLRELFSDQSLAKDMITPNPPPVTNSQVGRP